MGHVVMHVQLHLGHGLVVYFQCPVVFNPIYSVFYVQRAESLTLGSHRAGTALMPEFWMPSFALLIRRTPMLLLALICTHC